jgi:hypothetical protein
MDDTTKLIVLGALAYFAFVHKGGFFSVGPTAAAAAPPPSMPDGNTQAIASTISKGLDTITAIFNSAQQATATRGSGVSNV